VDLADDRPSRFRAIAPDPVALWGSGDFYPAIGVSRIGRLPGNSDYGRRGPDAIDSAARLANSDFARSGAHLGPAVGA
jgi:hypothetical protein